MAGEPGIDAGVVGKFAVSAGEPAFDCSNDSDSGGV